jgi:uncharacterized protein (TIRG00374 family)
VDRAELAAALRGASPWLLAASVAAFVADDLLVTRKWERLLDGLSVDVPFFRLFRVYLEGRFIGFFLPSSVTADLYKGAVLTRRHASGRAVVSSIVLERILGLVSIATIGLLAVGALPARLLGVGSAATVFAAFAATAVGLWAFLHADRIAATVLPWLPAGWSRPRAFLEGLADAFAAFRSQPRLLVETFLLSLLIQGARAVGVWIIARAVDDATPFLYFLLLVPYVYLVNLLPVASSRIGLEQGVFVVLFAAVGMRAETALAVSLLAVAGSFVSAIPGGLWLAAPGRRAAADRARSGG